MFIKLVGVNARFTHSCLALFYLRNELEKYLPGVEIEIVQLTINDPYYENILSLQEGAPQAIFFSAAIWNSDRVEAILRDLHITMPDCLLVVGGPQARVLSGQLEQGICSCVIGEIEAVSEDFYRHLKEKNLQPIYSPQEGERKKQKYSYPYREKDFSTNLQNRYVYYESSRGCPFSCSYCLSAVEKGSNHKPLAQVKEELQDILSYDPRVVRFVDRTFNDRPERALAIWKFLLNQRKKTLFHFEISPERFSEEMFEFLKVVPLGMFQFEIGIQSTHPATLKEIRRYIDPQKAHITITRLAEAANIHLHVDLILGLPYETRQSFQHSFRDVFAMGPHYIQMGLLKILPDTQICHRVEEYGYRYSRRPPYSVFSNTWMDKEVLAELYWLSECVEKFYNNRYFSTLWGYLSKHQEDMFEFFTSLLRVCKKNSFFSLAPTQEFLCRLLLECIKSRTDGQLIIELLRFDWLRCGHRFLPKCLDVPADQQPIVIRNTLFSSLPEKMEGRYDARSRKRYFKKGFFLHFSENVLRELGYDEVMTGRYLRFSLQREESLDKYNSVNLV